jgi:hypothetical protein
VNDDPGSPIFGKLGMNCAAMLFRNLAANVQPETHPTAGVRVVAMLGPKEALKNMLPLSLGNPRSVVTHNQLDRSGLQ